MARSRIRATGPTSTGFALWGIYHGLGLVVTTALGSLVKDATMKVDPVGGRRFIAVRILIDLAAYAGAGLSWLATLAFVWVGWVLFFYPVGRAYEMLLLLVR